MTQQRDRLAALVAQIADDLLAHGRKAASGEPLFFDRFHLERIILERLLTAEQESESLHKES